MPAAAVNISWVVFGLGGTAITGDSSGVESAWAFVEGSAAGSSTGCEVPHAVSTAHSARSEYRNLRPCVSGDEVCLRFVTTLR